MEQSCPDIHLKIINKQKNTTLAENAIIADTIFKRMKGLLGYKEIKKGNALILNPCNSIHTFFMQFPIDVLFLNKNNQVIKIIYSIKPFRLTNIYLSSKIAIEFPSGTIKSSQTQKGDIICFE